MPSGGPSEPSEGSAKRAKGRQKWATKEGLRPPENP